MLLAGTLLAMAPGAWAAVWLRFDPPKAPSGTVVSAQTIGTSGPEILEDMRLFLAPAKIADEIKALTDLRLHPIGKLVFDEERVGHVTFTVPDVPAGRYMTVASAPREGGAITVGPFRVIPGDSEGGLLSDSGTGDGRGLSTGVLIFLVVTGIALTGAGAVLVTRRYRRQASRG